MKEIYYQSDFVIRETMKDIEGTPISWNSLNFRLKFYTDGANFVECSGNNGAVKNCTIDEGDSTILHIPFKCHNLNAGVLKKELSIIVENAKFPNGVEVVKSTFSTEIKLVPFGQNYFDDYIADSTLTNVIQAGGSIWWSDIHGKPNFADIAESGSWDDIVNKPNFADIAESGSWDDIVNKPNFADIAESGSWDDIVNKPNFADIAVSGEWSDIKHKPSFAQVAESGDYNDLDNKPTIVRTISNESQTTKTLSPLYYYVWGVVASLNLTLTKTDNAIAEEFCFEFTADSDFALTDLSVYEGATAVTWVGEVKSGKLHQCSVLRGVGLIVAVE